MPFIHVRSLPFEEAFDAPHVLEGLAEDFAKGTGIDLEHVTATWEFFAPGHYAVLGRAARHQPPDSHPVLVDLLAPDFNAPAAVEKMLLTVASSLSKRAKIPGGPVRACASHAGAWRAAPARMPAPPAAAILA